MQQLVGYNPSKNLQQKNLDIHDMYYTLELNEYFSPTTKHKNLML
jgi:hypothetical protein